MESSSSVALGLLLAVCGACAERAPSPSPAPAPSPAHLNDTWDLLLERAGRRRYHAYERDPTQRAVGVTALKMMEQACYSTQYRLKEVSALIKRYEDDPLFRLANAFKLLQQWRLELEALHAFSRHPSRAAPSAFRVARHIVYYTHAVRKMIDVTYTVDYVKSLHNRIMNEPSKGPL